MYLVEIFGTQSKNLNLMTRKSGGSDLDGSDARHTEILSECPDEAELFFSVDREFRALMVQVRRNPAVVTACSKSGLFHTLKIMRKVMHACIPYTSSFIKHLIAYILIVLIEILYRISSIF